MKELQKIFTRKGILYSQITREGSRVLYHCKYNNPKMKNYWFEVYNVPVGAGYERSGEIIGVGEYCPSDEQFGRYFKSKTFFGANAEQAAQNHFNQI